MRYLKIILIFVLLLYVIVYVVNSRPPLNEDSLDLNEWNTATMLVMTEELHLDSVLSDYWKKDNPPFVSRDNETTINDFEEEILSFLSFREKILKTLEKDSYLLHDKPFYIIEHQGYTHAGFMRSFTIFSDTTEGYFYQYKPDKDCFVREKIAHPVCVEKKPFYYSEIDETGVMTGLHIVTFIHRDTGNKLIYKILEVSVW